MKFSCLRIITNDMIGMTKFYQEIFGIPPVRYSEDYIEFVDFETPACTLAIGSKRSMDLYGAGAAKPASNYTAILEFEVEDVDDERTRLKGVVSKYEMEPTTQPWGNRSMLFRDPEGNLINFFTPVADFAVAKSNV